MCYNNQRYYLPCVNGNANCVKDFRRFHDLRGVGVLDARGKALCCHHCRAMFVHAQFAGSENAIKVTIHTVASLFLFLTFENVQHSKMNMCLWCDAVPHHDSGFGTDGELFRRNGHRAFGGKLATIAMIDCASSFGCEKKNAFELLKKSTQPS